MGFMQGPRKLRRRRGLSAAAAGFLIALLLAGGACFAQSGGKGQEADLSEARESEFSEALATQHYYLAGHYFRHWLLELAEVELRESVRYWPDLKAAHRDLLVVDILTGHPVRALAEAMMVVGLGEPIPLDAAAARDLDRRAARVHYRQGIAYAGRRRWHSAIEEFCWALSYAPGNPAVLHSLAFAYSNIGDFNDAERVYKAAFQASPEDAYAHADFAFMLSAAGHKDQAEDELSRAVRLAPSAAALHVDLGWMAEARGDLATADHEFTTAIRLSSGHAGLWTHLGRIQEREGKSREAIDSYKKALTLDPAQNEAQQNLVKLEGSGPS